MSLRPKVLVMIPAYNEEQTVGEIVKSVKDLYPDFNVVVIDDGSDDGTVKNAAEAGAEIVSLPFHCGGSIAIQTGYLIASRREFDYTVKIDADGQHKPEEVSTVLEPLLKGEADITVGSRYAVNNGHDGGSSVKNGGRLFSSSLVSMLRKMEVTDVTSGMRANPRASLMVKC
jgi:glycosyltransferase involved in cell wall biosynthesis